MSRYPTLYILRHGETEWNLANRLQGHFDSPLTDTGRAQAAAQNAILKRCDLAGFSALSSPQGRAVATAELALAGLGMTVATDPRLGEIGIGAWAGKSRDTLLRQTPDARDSYDLYEHAPDGEGFAALYERCRSSRQSDRASCAGDTWHHIAHATPYFTGPRAKRAGYARRAGVVFRLEDGEQKG